MSKDYHPLHTPEWVKNYYYSVGRFDAERCTGRSTARALRYLAEAIENPGLEIICQDHFVGVGRSGQPPRTQNIFVARMALEMAHRLGLEHIHGVSNEGRIVFKKLDTKPVASFGNG